MALDTKMATTMAAEIVAEVAAVQKKSGVSAPVAVMATGPNDFCKIWPQAKPVLELIAGLVIFIPGAGTTAGAVLQALIKIGDQLSTQLCKP